MTADEETVRAFFAVDLDAAARSAAALLVQELRDGPGGDAVRWVRSEGLHVTLRFLGDVESAQVPPLARQVEACVAPLAPFVLTLGRASLFPSPRRPRVVALELAPPEPLAELAAAVERGVVEAGFEPEGRPFRAHLTLGRVRGRKAPATRGLAVPEGTRCPVAEVVLFRSELGRGGSKYTPLERMKLDGGV